MDIESDPGRVTRSCPSCTGPHCQIVGQEVDYCHRWIDKESKEMSK